MISFKQITIIGTGLIGGSFALALKKQGFAGNIIGCDREPALAQAKKMGAVDAAILRPEEAIAGSNVVVLSTPVGTIIDLIERLGPLLPPSVLLTDTGSTKAEIAARAKSVFGNDAAHRFLPGHPMAGKEHGGIEHADAGLFQGAAWLFTPPSGDISRAADLRSAEFLEWIRRIGATPIGMDAPQHDRLCAWVSHLPQMISIALAATLAEELADEANLNAIGGRALREMTRIAASPYSMWRDIAHTNAENIEQALLRMEQRLAHIRENLRSPELREEFERANKFNSPRRRRGTEGESGD